MQQFSVHAGAISSWMIVAALPLCVCGTAHAEIASIYGGRDGLCGHQTANGEHLNCAAITAAHRTLPFGMHIVVCHNGCVTVRINDRGPWVRGRQTDLSPAAARAIGLYKTGHVTISAGSRAVYLRERRTNHAFGLNFNFMRAVARIESGFDPKQRTGSYFGLFQLSKDEFAKYGSGDILGARDNAVAAGYKFATEDKLFELSTHKKATFSDLYLIHQLGTQGAEEHVNHPDRIAWKSMCATDEGKAKGEKWCKRAIWENTLPSVKRVWKSVENLTSGVFLNMWQNQVNHFYAHYSGVATTK